MIVYNTTKNPIFITTDFEVDPLGGPAKVTVQHCVHPGGGIELNILGLRTKEPKKKKATNDDSK